MNENIILVIDDSATIRRLCDGELSAAGYRVVLAPTAEDGVVAAQEQNPNLIILDHQLPGTTGYEVCVQLLANPDTARIPVIASSTLRKKAYAEYVDCDNVVDMLPKPYTPEALIATVENAINTAEMVVNSQCEGSAVPEVISELGEADLAGEFGCFGLREVIDLLNNGSKSGILEVETGRFRAFIHVAKGRIQAVTASGVEPEEVSRQMPDALAELAPVVKFTVAGRRGSEVDGLVQLLNTKVLDPRLLKKLLRLQAAILLRFCFQAKLKSFRFTQSQTLPSLFEKLPLDGSLLGLLVEGSLICDAADLPETKQGIGFVRRTMRGQNLDRAGLSSRHMRLMSLVAEPVTISQVAGQLGWPEEEVQRVMHGFEMSELVEACPINNTIKVFGVIPDAALGQNVQAFFKANQETVGGRIVRDLLALRLLLRRSRPDVLLVEAADENVVGFVKENRESLDGIRLVAFGDSSVENDEFDLVVATEFGAKQLAEALETVKSTKKPSKSGSVTDSTEPSCDQVLVCSSTGAED